MSKHLVLFYGRTGSTLLDHYITRNLCNPPFNFWEYDIYSSEIHPNEYDYFLDLMSPMQMDWSMKYHITTGTSILNSSGQFTRIDKMTAPYEQYNGKTWGAPQYTFDLSATDKFLSELGITDLHFSFRIDCLDTICSHLIADAHDSFVVMNNEIREHEKLEVSLDKVRKLCNGSEMVYRLYNEYVERYKDRYNCTFYPYEKLNDFFDTDNDYRGMKKQLTKKQKQELIINYDEVEEIAKEFSFYGKINEENGVLEL